MNRNILQTESYPTGLVSMTKALQFIALAGSLLSSHVLETTEYSP